MKLRTDSTEAALSSTRDLWNKGNRTDAVTLPETWLEGNSRDLTVRLKLASTYANLERIDIDAALGYDDTACALRAEAKLSRNPVVGDAGNCATGITLFRF